MQCRVLMLQPHTMAQHTAAQHSVGRPTRPCIMRIDSTVMTTQRYNCTGTAQARQVAVAAALATTHRHTHPTPLQVYQPCTSSEADQNPPCPASVAGLGPAAKATSLWLWINPLERPKRLAATPPPTNPPPSLPSKPWSFYTCCCHKPRAIIHRQSTVLMGKDSS